jgi:hypothetical protein
MVFSGIRVVNKHSEVAMDNSKELWDELKMYQYASCKIYPRCCRQVKLGAVNIKPLPDPQLMYAVYPLKLKYCPECGKEL